MIVWLNGTFGVGKTTTGQRMCDRSSNLRLFDPEHVGYLLSANLSDHDFSDFQDLPPWRTLVPVVMDEIQRFTGHDLLAVQTVLDAGYWKELRANLTDLGHTVFHVVLDCDESELRRRIDADQVERDARDWRLEHLAPHRRARDWMMASADLVVDTSSASPGTVSATILDALSAVAEEPDI